VPVPVEPVVESLPDPEPKDIDANQSDDPWPFPMQRPVEGDEKLAQDEQQLAEQANAEISELDPPEPDIEVVEHQEIHEIKEEVLENLSEHMIEPAPQADDTTDQSLAEDQEKAAMREWKTSHPESTIKEQRRLVERGAISEVPWAANLALRADNALLNGNVSGFGIAFPDNANKGDLYLRVDMLPTVLYKHNGKKWIEVDKDLSDSYAYDEAYIDFLIAKLESGEYDAEMLTYSEREQIAARLQKS
jgi:hypothetical protein